MAPRFCGPAGRDYGSAVSDSRRLRVSLPYTPASSLMFRVTWKLRTEVSVRVS